MYFEVPHFYDLGLTLSVNLEVIAKYRNELSVYPVGGHPAVWTDKQTDDRMDKRTELETEITTTVTKNQNTFCKTQVLHRFCNYQHENEMVFR